MFRYLLIALCLFFQTVVACEADSTELTRASIVADARTGEIIYSSNPDLRTQPASMTKMMTLKLLFKALREKRISMNTVIRISKNAVVQQPCKIGFKIGEGITVRNAIMALITKSANDVAVAVAERLAGSEKRFVRMMNKEARRLRMYSTLFCNASGWKNPRQLTTVRDMLKLSRALISEYPEFFPMFAIKGFYYKGKYYRNHNKLLGENCGITVDGLKTGFVCASGYNISVTARKGRDRVIVVVVGGKTAEKRDALVQWLLACSFNKLARKHFMEEKMKKSRIAAIRQANLKKKKMTQQKPHQSRIQQILENFQKKGSAESENSKEIPAVTIEKTNDNIKVVNDYNVKSSDNKGENKEDGDANEKCEVNPVEQRPKGNNEDNGKPEQCSAGILG